MHNILVVIPTYNEKNNITELINKLLIVGVSVLVVDDNSPDGTAAEVQKNFKNYKNVHLLNREKKLGLGSAYRDGFKWGLLNGFQYLIEMDADFSHQIKDLTNLLKKKHRKKIVIGSRYVKGGKIIGWSKRRSLLSYFANRFAKFITKSNINDLTSGFRIYSNHALSTIDFSNTQNNGYAFQIEMSILATQKNLEIIEVPITFIEREIGKSKMNYKIILEALKYLFLFKFVNNK